jgi:hypothetical protein
MIWPYIHQGLCSAQVAGCQGDRQHTCCRGCHVDQGLSSTFSIGSWLLVHLCHGRAPYSGSFRGTSICTGTLCPTLCNLMWYGNTFCGLQHCKLSLLICANSVSLQDGVGQQDKPPVAGFPWPQDGMPVAFLEVRAAPQTAACVRCHTFPRTPPLDCPRFQYELMMVGRMSE